MQKQNDKPQNYWSDPIPWWVGWVGSSIMFIVGFVLGKLL